MESGGIPCHQDYAVNLCVDLWSRNSRNIPFTLKSPSRVLSAMACLRQLSNVSWLLRCCRLAVPFKREKPGQQLMFRR